MHKLLVLFLCFIFFISCTSSTEQQAEKVNKPNGFDKEKWAIREDKNYPYRSELLKNYIAGQKLKGKTRKEVLDMLGEPDSGDSNHLGYIIEQKNMGVMVLHTRSLVVFIKDGIVTATRMHE